jgi:lysophospholipase L1-like esterase
MKKTNLRQKITKNNISISRPTYETAYYKFRLNQFAGLPHNQAAIMFLGDSLTEQGQWAELLKNSYVINRGINGDSTAGVLHRLDGVIADDPSKIFLMIGTNDIWNQNKSVSQILTNYRLILETLKDKLPQTKVYIQSNLPVNNNNFTIKINNNQIYSLNSKLEKLAEELGYTYIDLATKLRDNDGQLNSKYTLDGVHLNGLGYGVWAEVLKPFLN